MKKKIFWLICAIVLVVCIVVGILYANGKLPALFTEKASVQQSDPGSVPTYEDCIMIITSDAKSEDEKTAQLQSNFEKMDASECTRVIDTWIYGTYNTAAQYNVTEDDEDQIYHALKEDKSVDIDEIHDDELKNKLRELAKEHIVIRFVNGFLFYDIDYGYFHDSFGKYIRPDYDAMIALFDEEKTVDYCDEGQETLYTDVVMKRLNDIYKIMQAYPDSDIMSVMHDTYNVYKSIIFGAYAQDYIYENGCVKNEILEHYKTKSSEYSDSEIRSFMDELAVMYNNAGNTRTIPIYEKIKAFCGLASQ